MQAFRIRAGSRWTPSGRTLAGSHERRLEDFKRQDIRTYAYMDLRSSCMNEYMHLCLVASFSSKAAFCKRLGATAVRQKFAPLLVTSTHGLALCWHPPRPQGSMLIAIFHQAGVAISRTKVRTTLDTLEPTLIFGGAGGQDENKFFIVNEEKAWLSTSLV